MPTSSVWSFTDPGEFTARVRATSMELAITRSGRFEAKVIRIDLNRMWLQRFSDSLPRVAHFNHGPGRAIISFRTHAGPDILWDGKVEPAGLARHPECYSFFHRSSGPDALGIHVAANRGHGNFWRDLWGRRLRAAERTDVCRRETRRPDEASGTSRGGWAFGGECPRDYRLPRSGAGPRAGADRRYGRLSCGDGRRFIASLEQSPRQDHETVLCDPRSQFGPRHACPGDVQGGRRLEPHAHHLLPRSLGNDSSSLPSATAVTSRPSCAGAGRSSEDHSYPDRHRIRLLGSRTFRRRIPSDIR